MTNKIKYIVSCRPLQNIDSLDEDFPEPVLVFDSQDELSTYFRLKASQAGYTNINTFFEKEEFYIQKVGNSVRLKGVGH